MSPSSPSRWGEQESGRGRSQIAAVAELESTISQDEAWVSATPASPRSKIEIIEKELSLLRLRRADVGKRIRALRHAVAALIKVFGPAILDLKTPSAVHFPNIRPGGPAPIDVCREILRESPHSLSFDRIVDLVRDRAPLVLAQFRKPGVAISNALRHLQRLGEAEQLQGGKWRWKEKQELRISAYAHHHQWSLESQLSED